MEDIGKPLRVPGIGGGESHIGRGYIRAGGGRGGASAPAICQARRLSQAMLALIDNYDSFTYNLYQYLCELGQEVEVVRNDKTTIEEIAGWQPERIIVSPGPCTPKEAGISVDVIRHFGPLLPVLGVCLGHQCIGAAYGGVVGYAGEIMHGKSSTIPSRWQGCVPGTAKPLRGNSLPLPRNPARGLPRLPGRYCPD